MSFDELNQNQLLELTNKIFVQLDKEHDVNLREESQAKTLERFTEFLRILSYPGRFDESTTKRFQQGDKSVLSPIVYFGLANFEELKKRAYLGKFLVPIQVPDEYMVDAEIKQNYEDYMSLVGEFKEHHAIYEKNSKGAASPDDLKKVNFLSF